MPAKSVFISHSSKDDSIVRELRQSLESLGVETWTDSERLTGGDRLSPRIQRAIEDADDLLVVVSLDALNSDWVQREIAHAKSVQRKIIPLTRPDIAPPVLRLLFGEELLAIRLEDGTAAIAHALPQLLAALGLQRPTELVRRVQARAAPVADLVLELTDPAIEESDGKRRATAVATLNYIPADGGRRIESQRYRFTAPLGPIEAEEIAWYLERYINWPAGLFQKRAQQTVDALPKWGRFLYDSVNIAVAREALETWKMPGSAERRFTVRVEKRLIAGSPEEKQKEANEAATLLLGLPWELIHDDKSYLFQGARPVRVRRSLPNRERQPALATEPPIRVLLVSPRPEDETATYIDHRVGARPLVEALAQLGDFARLKILEPATFPALEAELLRAGDLGEPYHVVHFDGHGAYDRRHGLGKLCFEDPSDLHKLEKRRSQLIDSDEIARAVRDHRIPLFFLEACQTAMAGTDPSTSVAGRLLESGVASVAAMSHSVLVETARRFNGEFYRELLAGKRVGQAMLTGQRALKSDTSRGRTFTGELHLDDWFVPVLFQEEQDPQLIHEVPAQQVADVIEKRRQLALGELPDEPPHQFMGRSRDLLKAERMLAHERYLVIQGAGGEGKTALAAELARWMVATRRFVRAAFTSVEQMSEVRQVLYSLGAQLVANFGVRIGTDDEFGCQLVERALGDRATLLVIDNVESILDAPADIFKLCARLGNVSGTRLIFTSRQGVPAPFDRNVLRIGRLDQDTAIRVLSNLLPKAPESGTTEQDLEDLVEAVGGHARSLVLIAREVGVAGVRHATENLRAVMQSIEAKYPGERENSLLASAELSLGRLPAEIRQLIRPLSVFHGGGGLVAIALALQVESGLVGEISRALIGAGLAEEADPIYLRFDPAMLGVDLPVEERQKATEAWAEAMKEEADSLYRKKLVDANFANNLTLLELPNFLKALEYIAETKSADQVVDFVTSLEALVAPLNRQKELARIVAIRTSISQRLSEGSHEQYLTAATSIQRSIDRGRYAEAVRAANALKLKMDAAGETAYEGADYDGAMSQILLGQALSSSGNAAAALLLLESASQRVKRLDRRPLTAFFLGQRARCLTDLGRYNGAAEAYEQAIAMAEQRNEPRSVAVAKGNLGTVRLLQKCYSDALRLYSEAREVFERLNEPGPMADLWHQAAIASQSAGQYEAAEDAYQESLRISVATRNQGAQAATLNQLGQLYGAMGRREESVRLHRQAAAIYLQLGDARGEALARNNAADELVKLRRNDEARREIERARQCRKTQ